MSSDTVQPALHEHIVSQIDSIVQRAAADTKPLEMEPARGDLFSLFVTAHGAGYLEDEAEVDLTADELCKKLAARWGLDQAAQMSVARQQRLEGQELAQMRLLWSLMRMWMEWTYAWQRWEEFHSSEGKTEENPPSE